MKVHLLNAIALIILAILAIWTGWRFQVDLEPTLPVVCIILSTFGGGCIVAAWHRIDMVLEALDHV